MKCGSEGRDKWKGDRDKMNGWKKRERKKVKQGEAWERRRVERDERERMVRSWRGV